MLTIQTLREALQRAALPLQDAAGDDIFISRADMDALLASTQGPARELADSIYQLARELETEPQGRITRRDITRVVQLAEEKILPELELPAQPLSQEEAARLESLGENFLRLARNWKDFALEAPPLRAEILSGLLNILCRGLLFNEFYPLQANIGVYWTAAGLRHLNLSGFIEALNQAPEQEIQQLSRNLENPQRAEDATEFFRQFPLVQEESNRQQARWVAALMQQHLSHLTYFQFNSNYYENSSYFVAGLTAYGELVLLHQVQFWN